MKKGEHYRPHQRFREKDYLVVQYVTLTRSANDIAKEHGVTPRAIVFWMSKHGIPRRSISDCRRVKCWGLKSGNLNPEEMREYHRLRRLMFPPPSKRKVPDESELSRRRSHYLERKRRYVKRRRCNDVNFKLGYLLRCRVSALLRGKNKSASTLKLLGCSIENFKLYLESRWQPGMAWENYGRYPGWQIDHEMPCAIFDLTKAEHQRRCFHFSNLQPMWAEENCAKNSKVLTDQFRLL